MAKILLVDENDRALGLAEKMLVHERGLLHRAFSVFIFNSRGELLLQKRAKEKYHSGSLWSNTCCGHFSQIEATEREAEKRLGEEMGLACSLRKVFIFSYSAILERGLSENEIDYVFVGRSNQAPQLDPQEAENYRYVSWPDLKRDLAAHPNLYSVWLKIILDKYGQNYLKDVVN